MRLDEFGSPLWDALTCRPALQCSAASTPRALAWCNGQAASPQRRGFLTWGYPSTPKSSISWDFPRLVTARFRISMYGTSHIYVIQVWSHIALQQFFEVCILHDLSLALLLIETTCVSRLFCDDADSSSTFAIATCCLDLLLGKRHLDTLRPALGMSSLLRLVRYHWQWQDFSCCDIGVDVTARNSSLFASFCHTLEHGGHNGLSELTWRLSDTWSARSPSVPKSPGTAAQTLKNTENPWRLLHAMTPNEMSWMLFSNSAKAPCPEESCGTCPAVSKNQRNQYMFWCDMQNFALVACVW